MRPGGSQDFQTALQDRDAIRACERATNRRVNASETTRTRLIPEVSKHPRRSAFAADLSIKLCINVTRVRVYSAVVHQSTRVCIMDHHRSHKRNTEPSLPIARMSNELLAQGPTGAEGERKKERKREREGGSFQTEDTHREALIDSDNRGSLLMLMPR